MGRIINFEVVDMPKVYVVGKELRYSMEALMKGDNRISDLWNQCFAEELFSLLEKQKDYIYDPSYVGVMTDWDKGDGDFSYICGMLMNKGVAIPDGCVMREMNAAKVAVAQIKGKDAGDVCSNAHELTEQKLKVEGYTCDNMKWCMEFYNCPRFTVPDENGEIILDYYIPLD